MIWVVGEKGMLGKEVCTQLESLKLLYTGTDMEVDITKIDELKSFVKDKGIKWIINCSAYTAVDKAEDEKEKAFKINGVGVENLAKVAKTLNAPIIHISTDYVFSGNENRELTEDNKTFPVSVYGKSKLEGETRLQETYNKYFIIRTAWLYGKWGKNFVYTMLKLMNERDKISVVNDQTGNPTNAEDLARAIIKIIETDNNKYGIYHYSGGGETTWFEFAEEIYNLGKKYNVIENDCKIIPVTSDQFKTKAKRPKFSLLSKEKIKKNIGADVPLWRDSLEKFIKNNRYYIKGVILK